MLDKKTKKMKIDRDITFEKVLGIKGAEKVLSKYQFPCLHCPMAKMEMGYLKLGDVCETYGIDLKKLLKELNQLN